jgi:hypothetical protein
VLDALRRIMRLADGAGGSEAVYGALARELFALLGACDEALLRSKRAGKGRVELAG